MRQGMTKHEGAFLMWLNMQCLGLGGELPGIIISKCHVALGEGGHYGKAYTEFMRLNIGTTRKNLERALASFKMLYNECVK